MAIDIQINLGLALLILGIMATVVAIYYINYLERKQKPDAKPSMVTRSIIISLVIIAVILTIIYVSGREPKKWQYIAMVGITVIVFASQYYETERTKIKKPKQIFDEQWDHLSEGFHAKKDFTRFGHTWPKYKVTEIPGGKIFDLVANSLVKTDIGFFLVQSNPYDGSITSHDFDPDPQDVKEIFGENIARKYDEERLELIRRLEASRHDTQEEKTL